MNRSPVAATSEKPEFYKVSEVAKILNLTEKTVYRRINDGTLRAVKIGTTLRIPAEVIDELEQVVG